MRLPLLLALLGLIGSAPRLLTLLSLWQLKEWRFDRLNEHLRREGHLHQLWGSYEPMLIGALVLVHIYYATTILWSFGLLAILILVQGAKIAVRGQPQPTWTQKAIVSFAFSLAFTAAFALSLALSPVLHAGLLLLPLAQPFIVLVGWIIVKPIDYVLKRRILERAKKLRAQYSDLTVIGITGSAGKTTTKELLGHILHDMHPLVTPKHVNTEMGVAGWMLNALKSAAGRRVMIVEMGAYRRGEIALLSNITKPTYGIITSIGQQHLALFGSTDAIIQAKGELFAALPEDGIAFVNADDPTSVKLEERVKGKTIRVGTGKGADLIAEDITEISSGMRFRVRDVSFDVPVHGSHNVTNTLLAIAVAEKLGMKLEDIAKRLKNFHPPARTFSVRIEHGVKILDDTYNSSPDSFRAAMRWANNQPEESKTLLFSGIIELGKDERRIHESLGESAQDMFENIYMTNKNCMQSFERGVEQKVVLYTSDVSKVKPGSLLVCIGRMPSGIVTNLLP